jgi:hypothetical protein
MESEDSVVTALPSPQWLINNLDFWRINDPAQCGMNNRCTGCISPVGLPVVGQHEI